MFEATRSTLMGAAAVVIAASTSCVPYVPQRQHVPLQPPSEVAQYHFAWTLPEGGSAPPVEITIAVVDPVFTGCSMGDDTYKRVAKSFAASMSTDFDRALVAKGIKVSGPFVALNDMTYSDKKAADMALTPVVCVNVVEKIEGEKFVGDDNVADYASKVFTLKVEGFVAFVMKEPLSGEKLWVKKLDLAGTELSTIQAYGVEEVQPAAPEDGQKHLYAPPEYRDNGKLLYDGRQDSIGQVAVRWYPTIMNKAWTYLDVAEMTELKKQVEEIRKKSTVIQN
jgi:hypothetical protein